MIRNIAAAFTILVMTGYPAAADQNAGNLDRLFQELQEAKYPITAQQLENQIWHTWLDSGKPDVNAELEAGIQDMSARRLDEAIEHFTRVTVMAPAFAEGWNKRATAYFLNREPVKSMHDIQKTLSLEPRHFGAISGMGLIFLDRGDERSALKAFERVLEIHPMAPGASVQARRLREKLAGPGI